MEQTVSTKKKEACIIANQQIFKYVKYLVDDNILYWGIVKIYWDKNRNEFVPNKPK
jgi:hypothetical protein